MSGRAFVILMDEREQAVKRVEGNQVEIERLRRSVAIAEAGLSGAQRDLEDIEAAMRAIDPTAMSILEGAGEVAR